MRQLHCTTKPCHAAMLPCAGMPCQQSVLQLCETALLPHAGALHQQIVLQLHETAKLPRAGMSCQQRGLHLSQAAVMLHLAAAKLCQATGEPCLPLCCSVLLCQARSLKPRQDALALQQPFCHQHRSRPCSQLNCARQSRTCPLSLWTRLDHHLPELIGLAPRLHL